jgi:hypothetical protein
MGRKTDCALWEVSPQPRLNLRRRAGGCQSSGNVVLVRRDSEFGLLRDLEKQTQILGRSLEGCWGPAPRPPGFIALGHQQAWPNVLAGFERTEAAVAAEGGHCAGRSPAQLASENLLTASLRRSGCFPAEPCLPERHWRIRQGQAVVARLFVALKDECSDSGSHSICS